MKRMNTWNRILALVLALVLLLGLVPTYEVRANAQQELACTIDVLSENGVLEGNTVTFRDVELNYIPANGTTRFQDGWWVGIKVVAPESLEMEFATYQRQTSIGWTEAKLFKNAKDSADGAAEAYIELWGLLNEQYLNDAKAQNKNVHYGYRFDWDGNGEYEDVLHMEVVPTATTLNKDGKVVYPVAAGYATVNTISGGMQINGNCSDVVSAIHNQVTVLNWVAADANVGRGQDGWWLGIDVIAPSDVDLSKVTYQNKGSDGWGVAKSFNQYKDTANSIQLWGLLNETYLTNAVANNKKLNYQWRFDWNGDSVYEQLVMITIDPALVILHDSNGDQVYPSFGSVVPLTGGTVTGENTSLTLTIEEAVLQWYPANPDSNRLSDGWWVGMLVNAPEGYTVQQLANATYKRRATSSVSETGWGEYQTVSFADVRDTDTQVQCWMPLTQALVDKYQTLNKNIATEYIFDWNADGKDDQTITLEVVPSEKIVLKKVDQDALSFVVPYPAPQWVGEPYKNTAIGGSGDGVITYSIVEGEEFASINTQDGTLTFTGIGTIKVRAVKAGTSVYKEAVAEYTISTIRQSQKGEFKFENSQSMITVEFDEETFTNVASGGSGTGEVTYHVLGSSQIAVVDEDTGKVTFKGAGQVTIEARKAADELYEAVNTTYILEILMSEQPKLKVEAPASIVYSGDAQDVIEVSGGSKDINPTFTLVKGHEFAEVDPDTGAITTKAGDGTIVVSVKKNGNDGYKPTEAHEVTIYIEKASQQPLVFENPEPKITFNDNGNVFVNIVSGGTGKGAITYAFAEDTDAATIDPKTGKLTIKAAGKVKVVATKAADSCYKKQTATYELNINRDVPEFKVDNLNLFFGVEQHQIVPQNILVGEGKYTYTIGDKNQINAAVTDDGLITFDISTAVEGVVMINIHKAEDDQYEALEKTMTVTVSFLETDAKPIVSGDKKNASGWYTGDITIAAPENFQIIYCDELNTKSWSKDLIFNIEGQDTVPYVHMKNEVGITGPIAVEGLRLDRSCPTDLEISYSTPAWERTLETLTFGYYNPTQAVVTLSAKDAVSGIAYFTYNHGVGKVTVDQMTVKRDGTVEYSFTVDSDFHDKISFTAVDVAGWESALQDDKFLVVDLTAPELTVSYEYTGKSREEENVIYTNDKVKVLLAMDESNFDLSLINVNDMPRVKRDGDSLLLDWKKDENGIWNAEFDVENPGEHELEISYTDLSKNTPIGYTKQIVINDTVPTIGIAYEGEKVRDGIYHLVTATVTVNEKNFKPEEIELTVDAVDITGAAVDLSHKNYTAYAANPVNWTSQGDEHTLILPMFDVDAIYKVDISYTSMTGNTAEDYIPDEFIVDNTTPANIKIEYSQSVVDKVLERLTFGFYNSKVTVKVTAEDLTSGIENIWLDYIAVDGQNNTNKPSYQVEKVAAVENPDQPNVFTATLDIDPDARGKITAYVQDRADNQALWADGQHILVLDTKVPQLDVSYDWATGKMNEYLGVYYTQSDVNVKFTIEEANFDLAMKVAEDEEDNAAPVVTVNGEAQEMTWEQIEGTDQWVGILPLTEAGDYLVSISFADLAGNQMQTYTQEIRIDDVAPAVEVTYDQNEARNENCYKVNRTAGIVFTEHNFKPELIKLTVTAKDITGADVNIDAKEYLEKIRDLANWTKDGDVWTLDTNCMVFDIDAIYDVSLSYTDPAGNDPATYEDYFEIDKTAPSNIKIDYSESFIDKVLNGTINKFYTEQVTLDISAEDLTSGVEYFLVEYISDSGKNNSNKETYTEKLAAVQDGEQKNLFTAQMTIDAQARGTVKVTAVDRADNQTQMSDTCMLVVDTKVPNILPVEYEFTSNQMNEHNCIYYTQGDINITFTIEEANFDLSLMTADGEEQNAAPVVTVNGEAQEMTWEQTEGTDQWVGVLHLSGNGDYVVSISYADRSGNEMQTYTQEVRVDDIKPEINVTYDNTDAKNGNCYKADRTGTLVITEHNFLPEWVTLNVTAEDITGAKVDISAKEYGAKAKDPANWTQDGDVWTLDPSCLVFDQDASYTLSVSCKDLAENVSKPWIEEFVVDKTAPANVQIEYSQAVVWKLLEGISFGFYNAPVTVTVTAEDMTSGVDYIQVGYTKEEGTSSINLDSFITEPLEVKQNADKPNVFTATYDIPSQARGMISADVYDRSGNGFYVSDTLVKVVVDTKVPGLDEVKYAFASQQMREYQGIYYTQGETTITFIINEANFDLSHLIPEGEEKNADPVVTVNGEIRSVEWIKSENSDLWIGQTKLTGDGDYVVSINYADLSGNQMDTYTQEIHIDSVDPVVEVEFTCDDEVDNGKFYQKPRTAHIQIDEHNFNPEDVILTVTATNIKGESVDISSKEYSAKAKNPANWTQNGDVWTLKSDCMVFDIDANYVLTLSYSDLAENGPVVDTQEFVIDQVAPEITDIKYSAFVAENVNGYYRDVMTVEVTATDITSGVKFVKITYTKEEGSSDENRDTFEEIVEFEPRQGKPDLEGQSADVFVATCNIPAQARGKISAQVWDWAENDTNDALDMTIVVDNKVPLRVVSYTPYKVLDEDTLCPKDPNQYKEGDASILYYQENAEITVKITEANFDLSLIEGASKPIIKIKNTLTGTEVEAKVQWTKMTGEDAPKDTYIAKHIITGEGDYVVTMTYEDPSTNHMVDYRSSKIVIDGTAPVISTGYENGQFHQEQDGVKFYPDDQHLVIEVEEHNFLADDLVLVVSAQDIQGNPVDVDQDSFTNFAQDRANWTHEGDLHTLDMSAMEFSTDAIYTVDIVYDDILDNYAEDYPTDHFVIDHEGPVNLQIRYSEALNTEMVEPDEYGFYQEPLTVTISADDHIAGVDYFEWVYTVQEGASEDNLKVIEGCIKATDIVYSNNGMTATASFTIPAEQVQQLRGSISFTVYDRSSNKTETSDPNRINVVDNIAPEVKVTYEPTENTTKVQYVDVNLNTVESFTEAANAYYNGSITATIVVDEANFFEGVMAEEHVIHRMGIKVTRTDDNGDVTVTEYLSQGTQQWYPDAKAKVINWTHEGDIHTTQITLDADGDYVFTIDYTDLSENKAVLEGGDGIVTEKVYTSKPLTVDCTAPVVSMEYGNKNVIRTIGGRQYYAAAQSAVITVVEHNFRAADFAASVVAQDLLGQSIATENFAATMSDVKNWTTNGNTHTIAISYPVEANYTFDFELVDLAQNMADDYTADLFTVDMTPPKKLTVTYSTGILERVLNSITFGYYNERVKVTITAEDDVSGVYYFDYSYIKSAGVSSVNAQLLNAKLEEVNNNITHNGKTATGSFMIPREQLGSNNQFNGTVSFTAFDRSENNMELKDQKRLVVDNIKPTATVSYNAPVQTANNISYYQGNVNAQIKINEANFYKEDVVVKVDGQPVTVHWVDNSADMHTGTFSITKDGDHIVTISYKDRSNNEMVNYTSNTLTIDTVAPVVEVSNIKNNSANKDEKYSFTITATDINMDAATFQPELTATVRSEDGTYSIKTVSLGERKTVEKGKVYSYTVENLPEDAVYALRCTVRDMSGNEYSKVTLSDQVEYEQVRFSINRNGSTFAASKTTDDLVQQYYVYNVENDVILEEINVDPVENYTVRLNGQELLEGQDYTTTVTNDEGEWSKRTYVISKGLFDEEGEYGVILETKDKADTTAFSDVKNLNVSFVVDRTAPVLTITGLQEGGRYQIDEQIVTVIPTDDGGRLYSMKVVVLNSDGQPLKDVSGKDISVRFEMSGEEFLTYLNENNGKVVFTVPEGLELQVLISCNDCAVNAEGVTNEYQSTFKKVTVSQSGWIIFYANKPLFYGTIGGIVLALGLVILLIALKSKKKQAK